MYYCPDQAYKAFIPGIPWETTWVLFGSSSHFAPQKYFCGIKWDFDNLSWELDAAQIIFFSCNWHLFWRWAGTESWDTASEVLGAFIKGVQAWQKHQICTRTLGNDPYYAHNMLFEGPITAFWLLGGAQQRQFLFWAPSKGGFFSESEIRFSNLPISQKKLFQKTILSLKFE